MANNKQSVADVVCRMETFTKSLSVKVAGYSLIKLAKPEKNLMIATFDLASHGWGINFSPYWSYQQLSTNPFMVIPYGPHPFLDDSYMTLHVSLLTKTKSSMFLEVEFSLLDHESGRYSVSGLQNVKVVGYVSKKGDDVSICPFIARAQFEKSQSNYLKDDCFMLNCSVRLIKPFYDDARKNIVLVPSSDFCQSDLYQNFVRLWQTGEGADVAFNVSEEIITAHRNVLIARSPVFRAQFFSPMIEGKTDCMIKIEDMKPEVFRLMLHYIYTDTLPVQQEVPPEMAQHLLVAADRYGLERLKVICEEKLSANLDVETVATTLALAEVHNCEQLKEICIDFVASPKKLQTVMATDGFEYLMKSCPLILKDLLGKLDHERRNY